MSTCGPQAVSSLCRILLGFHPTRPLTLRSIILSGHQLADVPCALISALGALGRGQNLLLCLPFPCMGITTPSSATSYVYVILLPKVCIPCPATLHYWWASLCNKPYEQFIDTDLLGSFAFPSPGSHGACVFLEKTPRIHSPRMSKTDMGEIPLDACSLTNCKYPASSLCSAMVQEPPRPR